MRRAVFIVLHPDLFEHVTGFDPGTDDKTAMVVGYQGMFQEIRIVSQAHLPEITMHLRATGASVTKPLQPYYRQRQRW